MLPIDSVTGKPWSHANANLVLEDMKRRVVQEFRQRDERNSGGLLCTANGYKTTTLPEPVTDKGDDNGNVTPKAKHSPRLQVDPQLVGFKHSGKDTLTVLSARFSAFCAEPRDEKAETSSLLEVQRAETVGAKIAAAKGLEAELAEVEVPPIRRKPGRPKGTKNKPKGLDNGDTG